MQQEVSNMNDLELMRKSKRRRGPSYVSSEAEARADDSLEKKAVKINAI